MARQLRLEYAGACYHVINRGNYRRDLFASKGAAEAFEAVLLEAAQTYRWRVHAYVIMRNHFHLAVELTEPNLGLGMKWLQGTWATRFNRYRGEGGRPFQGRYKALHVEPGPALAQVCHYIHLNPVKAKVVTAEQLPQFRWSRLLFVLFFVKRAPMIKYGFCCRPTENAVCVIHRNPGVSFCARGHRQRMGHGIRGRHGMGHNPRLRHTR